MLVVSSFLELLASLSSLMTAPSFENFKVIASGWVLSRGRRAVTRIIEQAGAVGVRDHCTFHRFFSTAEWSLDRVSRMLLTMLLQFIPKEDVIQLAVDDTLCRKRGMRIFGACMHHDPLISCRNVRLVSWGHSWVVVGIILRFPFAPEVCWCLPFGFRLYISRNPAKSERWKRTAAPHRTRPELAVEILQNVANWFPDRRFHVFGDSAYGGASVLRELPGNFNLTSRLPLNAALYDDPPKRKGRGRPRKKGKRIQSPEALATNRRLKWKALKMKLYGKKTKLRVKGHSGLWKSAGYRRINITIVEEKKGNSKYQAFFTTDPAASSKDTLQGYARRWAIEVAFQNAKSQFGFEDPQNRTPKAVERTAPIGMVLYSVVIAWFAKTGHRKCRFPDRPWYRNKSTASFADMLATIRRESLREHLRKDLTLSRGTRKILRLFDRALKATG